MTADRPAPEPLTPLASFGATLRAARERAVMTLRDVGEHTDADFTYLSKIEHGHDRPSRDLVLRLDRLLAGGVLAAFDALPCPTCGAERAARDGGLREAISGLRDHAMRMGSWGIEYGDDRFYGDVIDLIDERAALAVAAPALTPTATFVEAADLLSKAVRAWALSGLRPEDWPEIQRIGIAYEQARKGLAPAPALDAERLREARDWLNAIVIRCEEGSSKYNWLPTIARFAKSALAALAAEHAAQEADRG